MQTTGVPLGVPLHPTQLYEALAEAIICLILIWRLKRAHQGGQIIGLYFLLYGMVRFAVEFLRVHRRIEPVRRSVRAGAVRSRSWWQCAERGSLQDAPSRSPRQLLYLITRQISHTMKRLVANERSTAAG